MTSSTEPSGHPPVAVGRFPGDSLCAATSRQPASTSDGCPERLTKPTIQTMNPITDYTLLFSAQAIILEKNVQAHLRDGWQLFGHPFSTYDQEDAGSPIIGYFCQAMIKTQCEQMSENLDDGAPL